MLQSFLDSADAAQVLELMRQAELSALQITEEVPWSASTWSVVLMMAPARLILRRSTGEDLCASEAPEPLAELLCKRLDRETLWRRVRRQLEARL